MMRIILNNLALLIISIIGGILANNHFDVAVPAHLILICSVAVFFVYLMNHPSIHPPTLKLRRTLRANGSLFPLVLSDFVPEISLPGVALCEAWVSKNFRFHPKPLLIALSITCCLGGAFLQHYQNGQWNKQAKFYSSYTMNARGTITDLEYLNPKNKERLTVYVRKTQLGTHESWQQASAHITVYTENKNSLQVGDFVEITEAKCAQLTDQTRELLRRRGIVAQVYRTRKIQLLKRPVISFKHLLHTFKKQITHQFKEKLSPQTYNLFSTIFLGKRVIDNNDNTDDYFGYWGLNHYLARAGLHLAFLFLMLNLLTSLLMLPTTKKACANLGICIGYYCLTWANIPFMRALTVIVGQQLCTILSIPINSLHLLNFTFLFYILSNTQGIFYLDTQLTFAITYAILLAVRYRAPIAAKRLCQK